MDEETIYYYDSDPVVSSINEMRETFHQDLNTNAELLETLHQDNTLEIVTGLWTALLLGFLIGIGLVIIFKRK